MVIRLLAEVTRVVKRKKRDPLENFERDYLTLHVRIKGSARKTLRLPSGLKGKQYTIARECLKDWPFKKGDYLILSEDETKDCILKYAKRIRMRKWKDFLIEDINGDGYGEISYSNEFLKAVIAPHYGARLQQFWNLHDSTNELYGGGFHKDKGYIEMGGIEETLDKKGNLDELWNAPFKRMRSEASNELSFSHRMKKEKGITVQKGFICFKELPLLIESIGFTFKPSKGKKKKGRKEKKNIRLAHRIFFAMGGMPDFSNLFHIPGKGGLKTIRFNRPLFKRGWDDDIAWWQWQHCHFTPDPGLIILENENTREILFLFYNRRKLGFLWTGDKKKTPRLQISYKEKTLKPKQTETYRLLMGIAHGFSCSETDVLFGSKGTPGETTVPFSFIYYTPSKKRKTLLSFQTRGTQQLMKKHTFPGIPGSFFSLYVVVPKKTKMLRVSIKDTSLRLRLKNG